MAGARRHAAWATLGSSEKLEEVTAGVERHRGRAADERLLFDLDVGAAPDAPLQVGKRYV
jgi:hypothetical protein